MKTSGGETCSLWSLKRDVIGPPKDSGWNWMQHHSEQWPRTRTFDTDSDSTALLAIMSGITVVDMLLPLPLPLPLLLLLLLASDECYDSQRCQNASDVWKTYYTTISKNACITEYTKQSHFRGATTSLHAAALPSIQSLCCSHTARTSGNWSVELRLASTTSLFPKKSVGVLLLTMQVLILSIGFLGVFDAGNFSGTLRTKSSDTQIIEVPDWFVWASMIIIRAY